MVLLPFFLGIRISVSVAPAKCSASISRWKGSRTIGRPSSNRRAAQKRPNLSMSGTVAPARLGELVDLGERVGLGRSGDLGVGDRRLLDLGALGWPGPAFGDGALEDPGGGLPVLGGGAGDQGDVAGFALGARELDALAHGADTG